MFNLYTIKNSSIASLVTGKKAELFARLHHSHAAHMCNMFAESKSSATPQVQVPSTQPVVPSTPQIIPSTPQIVPPLVERPVIQEFVPLAFNKFRQKKSKGKAT